MARTILEIYNEMVAEKQTMTQLAALQPNIDSGQTLLQDLTSQSKVAVWRLLFFCVAVAIWSHEKLWDEHKAWIENRATEMQVGTLPWYVRKAKEFQLGDSLQLIDSDWSYATVDESLQIVKVAAANEAGGIVTLKTAKLDSSSNPAQLTTLELTALQNYFKKVKFAGVNLLVVSRVADKLKTEFKVYYDPLVLDSTGQLISSPGTYPVNDAINGYIKSLPFDGVLSITALTDKIQQATGVINPVHVNSEAQYGSSPYTPIVDYYQANAGYLAIDSAFPLSSTITYIAL